MSVVRAAAIQMRSGATPEANLAALEPLVERAARDGATYALTPEVTMAFAESREGLAAVAGAFEESAPLEEAAAMARRHRLWLHIGSLAVALPDGFFANRSVLFSPDGEVSAVYDKIHLFDATLPGLRNYRESHTYRAGEAAVVTPAPGFNLGMSICYDIRFASLYNTLANAGAQVIAIPAAFTAVTGAAHWEILVRARAIETGCFVIAAAQGGAHENGRQTFGHSMIVDPWGTKLAEIAGDEPGVIVADLDLGRIEETRGRVPALANARKFSLSVKDRGAI